VGAMDAVLTFLVNAAWQVPVVGAASWTAMRLARRASAHDRERFWRAALLAGVLIPGVSVLRSGLRPSAAVGEPGVAAITLPSSMDSTFVPSFTAPVRPDVARGIVTAFAIFVALRWSAIAAAWVGGRRLVRRAAARPSIEILRLGRGTAASMGAGHVDMRLSDDVAGPVTVGIRRPSVLLPGVYAQAPLEIVAAALAHEIAHVRRRDYAWNLALAVVTAPVAFHPVVWMMRRRWAGEREMACDEQVCAAGMPWRRYARALVEAAAWIVNGPRPAPAMGLWGGSFEERIMRLRDAKGVTAPISIGARVASATALGMVVLVGAAFTVAVDVARVDAAAARVEQAVSSGRDSLRDILQPLEGRPVYQSEGRRDPFVDLRRAGPETPIAEGPERYRIGELSLRGIVKGESGRILMVWTPSNKTYFVRVGQRFSDGVLAAIGDASADFRQESAPFGGPVQTTLVRRELHTPAAP